MRFWHWQRRTRYARQRRLTALVALAAYLLTATGMPLSASVDRRDEAPFPCQHHACGCATAAQCWKHCCCFSPREKLAWAHEHHVEPPAHLVAEVAGLDDRDHDGHEHAHHDAHAATPKRACCQHDAMSGAHDDHDCDHGAQSSCHEHNNASDHVVIGIMALKCRGLSTLWCTCGAVITPPPATAWQFRWDAWDWLSLGSLPPRSACSAPLLRPPCA